MVTKRRCQARLPNGRPCRMPPLVDSEACWAHDPANADAAAEARRLVGLRRRREGALRGAYDFEGLTSVDEIRRLLEIATLDTLGLENSIGRARTLIAAAQAAAKLLETGELEERIATLEAAVLRRQAQEESVFDASTTAGDDWGSAP